ncbi:MAG: 3,4-dihydroxy-2-butanone-4-phosphate synthase [Candidatus Methylacidiphilales bacterium]
MSKPHTTPGFDSIPEIVHEFRRGRMVILTDDANRENEGDLVCAAEKITASKINFMARYGRGLICAPITPARARQLGLERMVRDNREIHQTDFTVSVDGASQHGVSTGISAPDRARTIRLLADEKSGPRDLVQPGHVFPLQAKEGGVLRRAGHTEAAVDLARLAGLDHSAVICEILKDNGSLARLPDLKKFARCHGLRMACIEDLIEYRRRSEKLVERESEEEWFTDFGVFKLFVYNSQLDNRRHFALVRGMVDYKKPVLVRVHRGSVAEDLFGMRGDGGHALQEGLRHIADAGSGVFLYLSGMWETAAPAPLRGTSEETGRLRNLREYGLGAQILYDLGVRHMRLLTNHPKNVVGLSGYGLELVGQVPMISRNPHPKTNRKS